MSNLSPMEHAIRLAEDNVAAGGGPFGAVLVSADGREFLGTNRVTATPDPTAHAEVEAIRAAARELGVADLAGSTLYASCEPCPMCLSAALWARVDRLVHAASQQDAADAGFDDATFYRQIRGGVTDMLVEHDAHPARLAPFAAWAEHADRTPY